MKKLQCLICILIACFFVEEAVSQAPFKSGNIIVSRIGDGSAALTADAHPVFLDEYTPAGVLVQSIPMPTSVVGSNKALTLSADDNGVGSLTLSPNGFYLGITGYNATVGTLNSVLIDGTLTEKTNGLVDYNGIINTSTGLTDVGGNKPASLITTNGIDMWGSYFGNGTRYVQVGNTTSTSISSAVLRRIAIRNGQLFGSFSSGLIAKVGTGLPTTGPNTNTFLTGISSGSHCQFVFADMDPSIPGDDVVYVANEGSPALKKYSLIGSTWTSNGQIGVDADNYIGITAVINGNNATLYIIRKAESSVVSPAGSGELVSINDNTGYNGAFTGTPIVLATAGNNMTFRGVAMTPVPPSVSVSAKAFLQGAYNIGLGRHKDVSLVWRDVLRNNALNQPFNVAPFNYAGTESVAATIFNNNPDPVNTDILDWVLLELHDATSPSTIVARKACFIREDGQIVDLDGTSNPSFPGVGANYYYIVLKHRNHLTIRSSSTVFINGAAPTLYDFSTAQAQAFQNGALPNPAMKDLKGDGTVFGMWGGNANGNTTVRASGAISNNDYLYLVNILLGGNTATILTPVYNSGDLNLDGSVRASGALTNNDYLILVNTILGGNTANIYTEHQ